MTLTEPPPDYTYGLFVAGQLVTVVVGIVLAMRRRPGPWRSLLLAGLAATGFMQVTWWLVTVLDVGTRITSPNLSTAFGWWRVYVHLVELVGLAAVGTAAVLGRPPRSVGANPEVQPA